MEYVTVIIFEGGEEIDKQSIKGPVSAAQAKDGLRDIRTRWVGKLTEAGNSASLLGHHQLVPGCTYHLHLQEREKKRRRGAEDADDVMPAAAEPAAKRIESDPGVLVKEMIGQVPEKWPKGGWRELVEEGIAQKLPVDPPMYHQLMQESRNKWENLVVEATGQLPRIISICLYRPGNLSDTEYMAVCGASHQFISNFISEISLEAGPGYQLIHKQHRDAAMGPSRSASAAVVVGKRPDWSLVIQERHIAFGKDKAVGRLNDAVADVLEKAAKCLASHYTPVDGTVAYAAAGYEVQFIFLDLEGKESKRSKVFDIRHPNEQLELLRFVAGIYRALLVAQKHFVANPIDIAAAENVWIKRADGCHILRLAAKEGRRFLKQWDRVALQAYFAVRGTTYNTFKKAYSLGNGSNGLPEAILSRDETTVTVDMQMYGLDLAQLPPPDEQSYKAASRGLLSALSVLHDKRIVHCDVRAANLVWSNTKGSSVVLVDLDMACAADTAMPAMRRLTSWSVDTLDENGCYGKASDVHEAGRLLKSLAAGKPWSELAEGFCDELIGKRLTASGALVHEYLFG